MVSCGNNNEKLIEMKELALRILQEETDGFEVQSRLRDDIIDAMVRFKNETEQLTIPDVIESVCDNCEPVSGFYLGMTCPKCNKPFRSVKQTVR